MTIHKPSYEFSCILLMAVVQHDRPVNVLHNNDVNQGLLYFGLGCKEVESHGNVGCWSILLKPAAWHIF